MPSNKIKKNKPKYYFSIIWSLKIMVLKHDTLTFYSSTDIRNKEIISKMAMACAGAASAAFRYFIFVSACLFFDWEKIRTLGISPRRGCVYKHRCHMYKLPHPEQGQAHICVVRGMNRNPFSIVQTMRQ